MTVTIQGTKKQISLKFNVAGMRCAGCASRLQRQLADMPGMLQADVNLALEKARVVFDSRKQDRQRIFQTVAAAGFKVDSISDEKTKGPTQSPLHRQQILTILALLLSLPLVMPMILTPLGFEFHLAPWQEFLLATPVQFVAGAGFYQGAWNSLRNRAATMDVLVALGTSVAYFYSLAVWLYSGAAAQGHIYFESAAVIIALVLTGRVLERRAKASSSAEIRALAALRPRQALVRRDGREIILPVHALQPGDLILIRPGERLPVDGRIEAGQSELDEALITGESLPVLKNVGDQVVSGSLNGSGRLEIRCRAVGADTTLERIINLVEDVQMGRAATQRLVDRVSRIFVPAILILSGLTLAGWLVAGGDIEKAMLAAVSVLIIACPCALGLATPTAVVTGTGLAARKGILIRDIEILEHICQIDLLLLDKTGTLTLGQPEIEAIHFLAGDKDRSLQLALAAQTASEHPLARGFIQYARQNGMDLPRVEKFSAYPGLGLEATVARQSILIGNEALMCREKIKFENAEILPAGIARVFVAINRQPALMVDLRDTLRPESLPAVQSLKARHIKPVLLTGDRRETAEQIASLLGIDDVVAQLRPEGKAEVVKQYQRRGFKVAMMGDGINDAPALAQADLSIAMGSGSDVALETAGLTLMRSDPGLVVEALTIIRKTRTKIRQNLFWAFIYNLAAIPLAALGFLTPAMAGAAMALSSVSVVCNALLLKYDRELGK